MKKYNIAILGAGNIARQMAAACAGINDRVTLYAVASRSLEKAEAFAEKWGFEKAYGSYEELACDEAVDLVYVATPHSEHYANTKLCIEHGRNCLVEKAFCGNLKQTRELLKLAKEKKVFLTEAMWTRYQPSADIIKKLLEEGRIGKVSYIESDFSVPIPGVERMVNPALAGGALLDLGVYSLTVPVMYHGTDIKSVKAEAQKAETGVDEITTVWINYKDGISAKTKCSYINPENSNYAKIVGDQGYMVFGPINVPVKVELFDNDGQLKESIDLPILVNGYEYEVLESIEAIEKGELETKSMPHSETIRLMGWMDSVRNRLGIVFPFETKEDISHPDIEIWGIDDVFVD